MYIPVIVAGHILPSFEPQVGEISSRRKRDTKRKMRGWGTGEREGGGKVQQIPATPDPCLSWAWLWWKAWDKNLKRKPFIGRHCSVSLSKGRFTLYISLCLWDVDKREIWPRYISVPSMMQLKEGQTWGPSCRNPPFLLKKPRSCTFSSFAHSLYLLQWTFPGTHGEQWGDAGDACLTLNRATMFDLHLLVCVKVWNETQADPWETMQPLMSPGGLGVTVFDTEHWGFL